MPLETHEIHGLHSGPHILITGGVHGDEFEPMAACRRLIATLTPDRIHGRVTIVPVVNVPAFRCGHRTGEDEKDLARTCPGRPDGTPTEQIAHDLSALIRSADYYIDLHTGGTRLQVLPLTGYTLHPNPKVLEAQRTMSRVFGIPLIWGTDPNLKGRSLSIAREHDVPAIYAEYLGGGRCEPRGIDAYVAGCLNILSEFGVLPSHAKTPTKKPLVVEDDRPQSGHLQINHLAPTEGFFEPAVSLGEYVRAGEPFGTVCDLLGRDVTTIAASRTGLVIVIHGFSRVDAGSSCGVILEIPEAEARTPDYWID
jgi:predicted deacylase